MHNIDQKLQDLGCPVVHFVEIAGGLISRPRLNQALKNEPGKSLDRNIEDKLLVLLDEMFELKHMSLFAPDWSDTVSIRAQIDAQRAFKHAAKYDMTLVREALGVEE